MLSCVYRVPGIIKKLRFLFCFSIILSFTVPFARAQGDLLITPRRIVFEGSKKSVDLNLANLGKDTATYAISMVQIRMTEGGSFETITEPDPGQMFADKNIRFFPRSVTLGPGESQVVKVQLFRENQLAPGEYRSHLYFRAVEKRRALGEEETKKDTTTISIVLKPVFGITIPVIIRTGNPAARASLSDLGFNMVNDSIPNVSMVIHRSGNASVYGDLAIYHISPEGKETKVGIANGVAVYTPGLIRKFNLNLSRNQSVDYTRGTLRVIFSASSDVKPERYAEAELPLK